MSADGVSVSAILGGSLSSDIAMREIVRDYLQTVIFVLSIPTNSIVPSLGSSEATMATRATCRSTDVAPYLSRHRSPDESAGQQHSVE